MDRKVNVGARQYTVAAPAALKASFRGEGVGWITIDGESRSVEIMGSGAHHIDIVVDGKRRLLALAPDPSGEGVWVSAGGRARLVVPEPERRGRTSGSAEAGGRRKVTPSFPATVVNVMVEVGAEVSQGQPLVVVSAMKMELTLSAPYAGVVTAVNADQGANVAPGDELVVIEATAESEPSEVDSDER